MGWFLFNNSLRLERVNDLGMAFTCTGVTWPNDCFPILMMDYDLQLGEEEGIVHDF